METSVDPGIFELIARHEAAWNAHDPEALIDLFDEPMDFVNVIGMHHRSRASLLQEYVQIHTTFMKNSVIRMQANDGRLVGPEVAVAHAHWEMTGVAAIPGYKLPDVGHGVMTYVLVRRDKISAAQNTDVVEVPMPK